MKVIFLDIDGVMNSQLFYERRYKRRWFEPITYWYIIKSKIKYVLNGFKHKGISLADYKIPESHNTFEYKFGRLKSETDPLKWKWLIELCENTNAKICISSVWKNHFNKSSDWGKALELFGFSDDVFVGITARRTERGQEIKEWIDLNDVEKYAIIDDDSDMLPEQMSSFFVTDGYCGLSPNVIYRVERHLNK